jgi:hypothetical protein
MARGASAEPKQNSAEDHNRTGVQRDREPFVGNTFGPFGGSTSQACSRSNARIDRMTTGAYTPPHFSMRQTSSGLPDSPNIHHFPTIGGVPNGSLQPWIVLSARICNCAVQGMFGISPRIPAPKSSGDPLGAIFLGAIFSWTETTASRRFAACCRSTAGRHLGVRASWQRGRGFGPVQGILDDRRP